MACLNCGRRGVLCRFGIHFWKRISDKDLIGKRQCRVCKKVQIAYSIIGEYDFRGNYKICGWKDTEVGV